MKVKVVSAILLSSTLLFGCASICHAPWDTASTTSIVEQTKVTLDANMWGNKMPTIGEEPSFPLHGSLVLNSEKMIPADLSVSAVWVRYAGETFLIDEDDFDVEAINEKQWKLSFKQDQRFNDKVTVADVAVELKGESQAVWLVDKAVNVDAVY
ncbi:hypothetical protein [Vibrio ezurae]|uniref:Lipoprotein n=1 Tax=Vibrio ezurae NBRC 102218 TaxID=1219080 RepID=U3CRI9_9VIBR|nr:hypothetical protein [Vibrio ezurae]GAD80703.1 hypothetical protein VEZ01S_38_00920 [Vibrio ezurae NBRC 102218]